MYVFTFLLTLKNQDEEIVTVCVAGHPDEPSLAVRVRAWQAAALSHGYAVAMNMIENA